MLMTLRPRSAGPLALICLVLPPAAAAQTFEGEDGSSVRIYGQLNFGLQYVDDGSESFTNGPVDNNVSTSRVGLNYVAPVGGSELRLTFETALGFPRSDDYGQEEDDEFDWTREDLRKFEVVYSGEGFGSLSLGQGSMATDGAAGARLSGTGVVASPNPTELAGNFRFRNGDGALSGIEIDDAYADFDGPRRFRLRYDTPEVAGVSLGAAVGEEVLDEDDGSTYYDVALVYGGSCGDVDLLGAAGYLWEDPDEGDTVGTVVLSGGLLHTPSGLSLSIAGGEEDGDRSYGWVQLGWEGEILDVGSTALSVDHYTGRDFNADGSESDATTLAAVQDFDDLGLEAYVAWRSYGYDDDADDYRDLDLVFAGVRWRF
jgi:hypothetical protein